MSTVMLALVFLLIVGAVSTAMGFLAVMATFAYGWLLKTPVGGLLPKKSNPLITTLVFLLGWALFSYIGLIPTFLSIPLPSHYHYQVLKASTTDVQGEFAAALNDATVPVGQFDQLNESSKHQARLRAYEDEGGDLHFIPSAKDRPYVLSGEEIAAEWAIPSQMGLRYDVDGKTYRVSARFHGETTISNKYFQERDVTYFDGAERVVNGFEPDYLAGLLNRQRTEKLTPHEFAALLESRVWGQLIGWFPESGTALIYDGTQLTNDATTVSELRIYNVSDGTYQVSAVPDDCTVFGCISEQYVACLTPDNHVFLCDTTLGPVDGKGIGIFTVASANVYRDPSTGDIYLSAVTVEEDGSHNSIGFKWLRDDLSIASDLVYRDEVKEGWNWESSDAYCFADLAFAVFPDKTSINYLRLSDPWE